MPSILSEVNLINLTMTVKLIEKAKRLLGFEGRNRIDRAIEVLGDIRGELEETKVMLWNRLDNIEDILMGESH